MPKYLIRLRDAGQVVPDDGTPEEFPDLETAKTSAVQSAREILSEAALSGKAGSLNSQIEVHDETGGPLLIVSCGRAVDTDTQN